MRGETIQAFTYNLKISSKEYRKQEQYSISRQNAPKLNTIKNILKFSITLLLKS